MLRTELADIEARRLDSLVAVAQAEGRLEQAEGDGVKLSSENSADLAKQVATLDQEIATARETMTSAQIMATILYRPSAGLQGQTYEILRQSKDGAKTLEATETSPLMPGDVLKIDPGVVGAITPGSFTPETPSSGAPFGRMADKR